MQAEKSCVSSWVDLALIASCDEIGRCIWYSAFAMRHDVYDNYGFAWVLYESSLEFEWIEADLATLKWPLDSQF